MFLLWRFAPTNRKMLNKTILFDFVRPYDLIPKYMGFCERSSAPAERSEQTLSLKNSESFVLSGRLDSNQRSSHPKCDALATRPHPV